MTNKYYTEKMLGVWNIIKTTYWEAGMAHAEGAKRDNSRRMGSDYYG